MFFISHLIIINYEITTTIKWSPSRITFYIKTSPPPLQKFRCSYELQQQHHKYQEPTTTITTTDISEVQRKKEIKSNLLFAIICNNFLNLSNFIYIQQPSSFKRSSKSSVPVKDECRHTFYRNQMVNGECKMHIVAKREKKKKHTHNEQERWVTILKKKTKKKTVLTKNWN